jgi:predicted regulator of Ras-like GTPase activity (Roadblock/LC7/MglB family)
MATKNKSTAQESTSQSDRLTIKEAIGELMDIEGAVGAAVVDYESGMTLGIDNRQNLDMELAGAGTTEVVRSKKNIIHDLGIDEEIQDILVSLDSQYHLLRMSERHDDIFMYVVIERNQGNLGLARRKIDDIEKRMDLD